MNVDAKTIVMVLIGAAVFAGVQGLTGVMSVATQKRKLNQRLKVGEKVVGVSAMVVELRKQRGLTATGSRSQNLKWLSSLIVASGLPYDQRKWLMYLAAATLILSLGLGFFTRMPIGFAAGALLGGVVLPLGFLKFKAGKRNGALGHQLPQALDIIVRSLEAGHPVPAAVALVGREMSDPIGTEFGMAADEIAYGATLEQAVERMSERCQHADIDLFAATVRLQERTGGNLTGLLKLNANTVRDRHKMRLKIQAASSEGRASAMILTAAPFVAVGAIMIISPKFYGDVIHEPAVRYGLAIIGFWIFVGNMIMRRMIDMRL
ncbi:MAG: type II secretion system F family protein [Alphaproteobacteria bacterium]|nr:type II secretion system F family protein [Alphaproteobacteria bacterium]MBU1515073.1 type II secretion system F family protein [Alphaproteobacteria bacterium]MBU2093431.1 type II secretion system F family protein [Alphaproteobacteria bacterium]MBU2149754.1 type II secretion system F family protein [Alphaproteobacteria bacterium]MBU2308093.1 type II secretion system F family protein [Alphaproteobacteria bacterium]